MTLLELIEASEQRLIDAGVSFGHGTQNAFDEAAWLVLLQLGLPLDTALDGPDSLAANPVSAEQQAQVEALVSQRISSRKPAAYLTHEAWLQGVAFYVDERCIVPRSLIAELLADGSLDYWLSDATERVLDLCTGNGSLAILAALSYPEVHVSGSDLSSDALAVARINVERHGLQQRIVLIASDGLAAPALRARGPFDLILCNPPYVNADSMAALPPEYQAEPELALHGGTDGMDFVRQLLRDAPAHMRPDAVLVLEIGHERAHFEAAFPDLDVVWLDTSAGGDQVLLIKREALQAYGLPAAPADAGQHPDFRLQAVTTAQDYAVFKILLLEYADKDLANAANSTIWQDLEDLQGRYGAPRGAAVLAYAGDRLAGCGALAATQQPGVAEIKRIYVRAPFRRQGLARTLTRHLAAQAQAMGYAMAAISTWPENTQALALYRALGFAPIAPFKIHKHAQLVFLGLPLNAPDPAPKKIPE